MRLYRRHDRSLYLRAVREALRVKLVSRQCLNSSNRINGEPRCAAESRKPRPFAFPEFAQDSSLEIDKRSDPLVLILRAIMRGGQYRYICPLDFFTVSVLHFVITGDK